MFKSFKYSLLFFSVLFSLWFFYKKDFKKEKRLVYIAYGSNMNRKQMKELAPESRLIGKSKIKNYVLRFKGEEEVYATIEKKIGSEVPVFIWSITKNDEKSLDEFEEYPDLYTKEVIEYGEKKQKGLVYIMSPKIISYGLPTLKYLNTIQEEYRREGINEKPLEEALRFSKSQLGK